MGPDHHAEMEEHYAQGLRIQELEIDIERLTLERDNILKAVLYHFGPEGANKVCTSVLDMRASGQQPATAPR